MTEQNKKPQLIVIGHIPQERIKAILLKRQVSIDNCDVIIVENEKELYEKHGIIAPQTPNENFIRETPVLEFKNYHDLPMDTVSFDYLTNNSKPFPPHKGGKKNKTGNKWRNNK